MKKIIMFPIEINIGRSPSKKDLNFKNAVDGWSIEASYVKHPDEKVSPSEGDILLSGEKNFNEALQCALNEAKAAVKDGESVIILIESLNERLFFSS